MSDLVYNLAIKDLLADLATLNPDVGPDELISLWFDELYFPGQMRPENYPLESWEKGEREWRECFTDHEMQILAEFHKVFESEVDFLTKEWPEWQQNAQWLRVSAAARAALGRLS